MTVINMKTNNKFCQECGEKVILIHSYTVILINSYTLLGMYVGITTVENRMEVSKKLKEPSPCDPEIPPLYMYQKK